MSQIEVDKKNLTVTLRKSSFSGLDCEIFRMYGFVWSPDGVVEIQIRGTAKKALWSTMQILFPNIKMWEKEVLDKIVTDIAEVYSIFEKGFDKVATERVPLYGNLFEHQKECVRAQCYKKYNLLSLEQGLGKSMAALLPSLILDTPLTLIVVPNSLKYNWLEELTSTWQDRFGYSVPKEQISIMDAKKGYMRGKDEKFIIINYDILDKYYDYIVEQGVKRMIIDECHYIKNRETKRTKTIRAFVNKVKCSVSFLSGTPATNTVVDIFSYLEIARHYEGQNYKHFMNKYCDVTKTQFGYKVTGAHDLDILSRNVQNFMIRKLKKDCLDLPDKNFIKINFDNEEYDALYEQAYKELMAAVMASNGKRSVNIESCMSTLQVITSKAKVKPLIEFCEGLMQEVSTTTEGKEYPKKVAVMCNFKEPLKMLKAHFKDKCVMIDGSVTPEDRMKYVNSFRKDDSVQVFLGQTTAAGVGLNMIECSDVIFLNFPYTRAEIDQASDRFHRIGTWMKVSVYFTVLVGKIDELVYRIVQRKYRDVSKLIDRKEDNTETVDVDVESVEDLFSQLIKEVNGVSETVKS